MNDSKRRRKSRVAGCIEFYVKCKRYVRYSSTYSSFGAPTRDVFKTSEEYDAYREDFIEPREDLEGELITPQRLETWGDDDCPPFGIVDKGSEEIILKYKGIEKKKINGYTEWWDEDWYWNSCCIGPDLRNVLVLQPENNKPSSSIVLKEYVIANESDPIAIPELRLERIAQGFAAEVVASQLDSEIYGIHYNTVYENIVASVLLPFVISEKWKPSCGDWCYCDEGAFCEQHFDWDFQGCEIEGPTLKKGMLHTLFPILYDLGFPVLPEDLQRHISSYLGVDDIVSFTSLFVADCRPLEELFLGQSDGQYFIHYVDDATVAIRRALSEVTPLPMDVIHEILCFVWWSGNEQYCEVYKKKWY